MANCAMMPMKNIRITQTYLGGTSHEPHTTGDYKDYPLDLGGKDTGKEPVLACCDEIVIKRVYGIGNRGVNTVFWESTTVVNFPDGTKDYLCGFYTHSNDTDLKTVKAGNKYKRGQIVCYEGTDGGVGMHCHCTFGKGKLKDKGWIQNSKGKYVLHCTGGTFKPEKLLYIDPTYNTVISTAGLSFAKKPATTTTTKAPNKTTTKASFLPSRGYFTRGDNDVKVAKIANYFITNKVSGNSFGEYLESLVKTFQAQKGLTADGKIGPSTLAKLKLDGMSVPKNFLPSRGYFVRGDRSDNVKIICTYLGKKLSGNYFGPYLTGVIKVFQAQNKITVDGNIGPSTLSKLKADGFKE